MKTILFGMEETADVMDHYFTHDSEIDIVAFTVDGDYMKEDAHNGRPVVAFENIKREFPPEEYQVFVAIGFQKMNSVRAEKVSKLKKMGYSFASYLSSRAYAYNGFVLNPNTFIMEHNTIQPFVDIGENTILWSGNHIGHHTIIHDDCFISSHAVVSGRVTIGARSFIGVNSTIRDGVTLGEATMVGAGALVLRNAHDKAVFIGDETKAKDRLTSDRLRNI